MHAQTIGPARYKINRLLNFGGQYIYMDNDQRAELRLVHEKMINRLVQNTVIVVCLIVLAFGMIGAIETYLIIFDGARVTLLGTELPFFDENSNIGFWLNISIQTVIAAVGMCGCLAIEIGAALIFNAILAIPHLIHVDLGELESELNSNGITWLAKARLRNVFMKIQDYMKYICNLSSSHIL